MCRNIRTLHNFDPPASADEVHGAALQYVRKISGSTRPSQANAEAFARAVAVVEDATRRLLDEEQQELTDQAHRHADKLITENRHLLDEFAATLLTKEVLERDDIDRIMSSGRGPSARVERLKADLSKAQIAAAERLGH